MPRAPGAARAPDAMHVRVVVVGQVEVDHVRDALHVDAARGDIGRDERVDAAALETAQAPARAGAASLLPCIGGGRHAVGRQALDQPVGAALGAHEHERQIALAGELLDERCDAVLGP